MKDKIKSYINSICSYIARKKKIILFILIFTCVSVFYNQNFQTLNYVLKRGTILEYSIKESTQINKEQIKSQLQKMGIKYCFIDETNRLYFSDYDSDEKLIEKSLYIAIPVLLKNDNIGIVDKISDNIFKNYQNTKLTDVISSFNIGFNSQKITDLRVKYIDADVNNALYSTPYHNIIIFFEILFVSFFIWLVFLYLIYDKKTLTSEFKDSFKKFYQNQKKLFSSLIKNTKEKGVKYLLKVILLDDNKKDAEDINATKEIINTIIFVIICVILIRYFIGELRWIPSGSMRPTILEHDRVFVEKLDFPKKNIHRGDILVFYPPEVNLSNSPLAIFSRLSGIFCKDIAFIKRVIGMPNDKFEVKYNEEINEYRVYINDKPLNEPYIYSKSDWTPCTENLLCGPFVIPEGKYFMMGDNRGNSQDSRFWGFLDENRIIGRANFMFFPFKRINFLRDKYFELHKNTNETSNYILNRYEFLYKI